MGQRAEIKDEAIVLSTTDLGEADLLVSFLTKGHGKQKGIGRHAKKSRKRFPNCLFSGNWIHISYLIRPQTDLMFLLEATLIRSLTPNEGSLEKGVLFSYALKLSDLLLPAHQNEPEVFELLKYVLYNPFYHDLWALGLYFESRLLSLLGYGINFRECLSCKRTFRFEGIAWFSPEKGGILCGRCKTKAEEIALMPKEAIVLSSFQEGRFGPGAEALSQISSNEKLSKALVNHMARHVSPLPKGLLSLRKKILG